MPYLYLRLHYHLHRQLFQSPISALNHLKSKIMFCRYFQIIISSLKIGFHIKELPCFGQPMPHMPQFFSLPTCLPNKSTLVEHQYPSLSNAHPLQSLSPCLNGKIQEAFGDGPPMVLHSARELIETSVYLGTGWFFGDCEL